MAYTRLTLEQLYKRIIADMEARLTSGVKIPSTSSLSVLAFGMAGGSYLVQGFLQWIYEQMMPDLADETGIGRWSRVYGVPRKSSTYTTGECAFTGTTGIVIDAGTQLQNASGLAYESKAAFTIGTTTSVEAEALESGDDWNITSGLELVQPLTGVDDDVTIVSGFDNGVDAETFDNWVLRILQRIQNPPSSGIPSDYERWMLEVDGVGYAWCFPAEEWVGAGTVGCAASDGNFEALSAGILSDMETYVEAIRPIPAEVTYYTPTPEVFTYNIDITPNTEDVQNGITTSLEDLYKSDAAPGGTIYISRVRSAISAGGASDYTINVVAVDGTTIGEVNYTSDLEHVAQLDSNITFGNL